MAGSPRKFMARSFGIPTSTTEETWCHVDDDAEHGRGADPVEEERN